MTTTTIITGPRTRAGQALAARASARGDHVVLVARHAADVAALAGGDATVLRVDDDMSLLGAADGPVRVLACALGPVHPDVVGSDDDRAAFERDLAALERLMSHLAGRARVGVVLVSSIIALAPGPDRRYYGGWKCLVEQRLAEVVAVAAPQATFSVVYPGRLVDGGSRPVPGLHTSYRRLAATVESLADSSRARISGLDARLWLVLNGLRVLLTSVVPPRASASRGPLELPLSASERNSRP